jgi:large subunit ribosomal protein L24e
MKRNPRKVRWTKAFRTAHKKEMTADMTFEFERKRNVPIKYNRDLMANTIRAMQRIAEIKQARQQRFYQARMKLAERQKKQEALRELKTNSQLLRVPQVHVERRALVNKLKEKLRAQQNAKVSGDATMSANE